MFPHAHNRKGHVRKAGNVPRPVSASDRVGMGQSPVLCLVSPVLLVLLQFLVSLVDFRNKKMRLNYIDKQGE